MTIKLRKRAAKKRPVIVVSAPRPGVTLYRTALRPREKRYREVSYSSATKYVEAFESRLDGTYDRFAVYLLMISIRDLLYDGKSSYACNQRRNAINWFRARDYRSNFSYRSICQHFGFSADSLWMRVRRLLRSDKNKLAGILKSAESSIFDNPKSSLKLGLM